jgi:hypothetical protein
MTGNSLESGEVLEGNSTSPNGDASQERSGTSGEQKPITREEFNTLFKTVETLKSEDRSQKDKAVKNVNERIGRLEESVNPLLERAALFMQQGDSPKVAIQKANDEFDEAETKGALRELAQAWKSGKLFSPGTGTAQDVNGEVAQVFARYGVSANDPVAVKFYGLTGDKLHAAVADYALEKTKIIPPDSSEVGALQSAPASQRGLMEEYEKQVKGLRGNAVIEKKMEFRKRGLDIN